MERNKENILKRLDWFTIILYALLATMGWLAICGSTHTYIDTSFAEFFNMDERSGKQAMWMGVSLACGLVLLCIPKHMYKNLSIVVYAATMLLGIVTIFIATDIKGSHSWIAIGSFRLQPAEFMKSATALMLAALIGRREFKMSNNSDFIKAICIILLPMIIIVAQKETGSALVYLALFLVLYREGMTGIFLLAAVSAIIYFVVGIKYGGETMAKLPVSIGEYATTVIIQIIPIAVVKFWCRNNRTLTVLLATNLAVTLCSYWVAVYLVEFNIMITQYALLAFNTIYLLLQIRLRKEKRNLWVAVYIIGAIAFNYSCSYVMHNVLKPHQKIRIEVLLGLKEDLNGAGYNVHQSKIAIGSGGAFGKGFLNGTQTKLNYVPEQDTDFIFCTIGEEQGFAGSAFVLAMFVIFILRIIHIAER
ncbi:MAG: rod shape-determining protein RodA, partial [Bacteroidaceae bacterium]|nr:rod shape-determining protein RodA [Bacteroidaceae bacterium]